MAREIGKRRIGVAAAILGNEYLSTFVSPTFEISEQFKRVLRERLGLEYLLMVLGDSYEIKIIKDMVDVIIDEEMMRMVILMSSDPMVRRYTPIVPG